MAKEDNLELYKTFFNKNKPLIPNFIFNVDENINSTDIANHFKIRLFKIYFNFIIIFIT